MAAEPRRLALALVLALGLAAAGAAQDDLPRLRAVCAGARAATGAPALQWLFGSWLPARPEWPAGLAADQPFALELGPQGLVLRAAAFAPPPGALAAGAVQFADDREALWQCQPDGTEDWFAPADAPWPAALRRLATAFGLAAADGPHTLAAEVAIAHLAGAVVEGDPRAAFVRLAAPQCGDVTWSAWTTPSHLRVRGRSAGGLLLPAVLALLAHDPARPLPALDLRAYSARHGDRGEAARQLLRAPGPAAPPALRALLHAEDEVRLAAIDALVRRRAAEELPRIVAAAGADRPWASLAVADAVRALWPAASPAARTAARRQLAASDAPALRGLDVDRLPVPLDDRAAVAAEPLSARARGLLALFLGGVCLYCLWLRERARLRRLLLQAAR